MPNVRIFGTDSSGNSTLMKTIVFDKKLNVVEVIDHVSKQQLDDLNKKCRERIQGALEDLARQNPTGLLNAISVGRKKKRTFKPPPRLQVSYMP